jgi:nitric oxide reductase NorE protein
MHGASTTELFREAKGRLPGETGIWLFVIADMLMFSVFFCTFILYRQEQIELFSRGQAQLNQTFGMVNTLLLLTSSIFVVHGVRAARRDMRRRTALCFGAAFILGAGFGVVKMVEYAEKFSVGVTPLTDMFFTFYFMLTGVHFLHVLLGLVVLAYLWNRARQTRTTADSVMIYESGATFWHMVDLLWIILFPLLYLIK